MGREVSGTITQSIQNNINFTGFLTLLLLFPGTLEICIRIKVKERNVQLLVSGCPSMTFVRPKMRIFNY